MIRSTSERYREELKKAYEALPPSVIKGLRGKRLLITGARGLTGSFLVDMLAFGNEKMDLRCHVYAAGRNEAKLKARFASCGKESLVSLIEYEPGKPMASEVWQIYKEQPDYVIHLAGSGTPGEFIKNPAAMVSEGISGACGILELSARADAVLFASSGEVYGECPSKLTGERGIPEDCAGYIDTLSPRSTYPLMKKMIENIWVSYDSSARKIVARLCHIYGPTFLPEESRIAGICLKQAAVKEDIVLKSRGSQVRSWCYVSDCAAALLTILSDGKDREAYNVAPRDRDSIAGFAEKTALLSGTKVRYEISGDAEQTAFNPMDFAVLDSSKLRGLGWKERCSLREGIAGSLEVIVQAGES